MNKLLCSVFALLFLGSSASAENILKLGVLDPMSGGGALLGENFVKEIQLLTDEMNARGGILGRKVELVPMDSKGNPQESVVQVQKAADEGIRFIIHENSSAVGAAVSSFVKKYAERNPGHELLYLNAGAVDPALTNEKCTFWHFRWEAGVDIKTNALTEVLKQNVDVKKVYLINPDYSFGAAVSRYVKEMLTAKRPDIQIVADDFHPVLKVTDFAPYVAKIQASGADTVVTGNFGSDLSLLLKAAAAAGLHVNFYTYYAGAQGDAAIIKNAGLNHRVFRVNAIGGPDDSPEGWAYQKAVSKKLGRSVYYAATASALQMLKVAAEKANSIAPMQVGLALEGLEADSFGGGTAFMRKDDHQFFQTLFVSSFGERKNEKTPDEEGTGWGWENVAKIGAEQTVVPTTCVMSDRPDLTARR